MKLRKQIMAVILAGLLAMGAVACETTDEDPLEDGAGTPTDTLEPTPTDT